MFLDCPAYLDKDGAVRCGLPAEVRRRHIMRSTDGFLESAMIRCPVGHWFNGPIEFLTWERKETCGRASTELASPSKGDGLPGIHCRPDGEVRPGAGVVRAESSRPNGAPAYYLGRPAWLWVDAMCSRRTASDSMVAAASGRPDTDGEPERWLPAPALRGTA
jgi:hypothetical protein